MVPANVKPTAFLKKTVLRTAQCVLTDGLPSKLLQDQEVLHLLNTLLSLGAGAGGGVGLSPQGGMRVGGVTSAGW